MLNVFIIFIFVSLVAYFYIKTAKRGERILQLQLRVQRRQELQKKHFEEVNGKLNEVGLERREKIRSLNFDDLLLALKEGEFTCLEVLRTFQESAIRAHEKTNCITLFILEAEEWAKRWDAKAADNEFEKPPLFGLPISIKECVCVKGYDHTRGYASEIGNVADADAPIVQQLKELGAIPFVLTNVPQSLLTFSCMNPIYGITTNPHDKTRTPGGSSGGEAAIVASGGSLIGIGGDVGGSIRTPCHFAGIAGIKPSHLRFSQRGSLGSVPGRPLINASDGPMALDIATCIKLLKVMWNNKWMAKHDPYVPPVDWNQEQFSETRPLRIGYYTDDGWFRPTPPLQRAVLETKQCLESLGHQLIPFEPPNMTRAFQLFIGAVSVDGGKYLLNLMSNDLPLVEGYSKMVNIYRIPLIVQRMAAFVLDFVYPRIAHALRAMPRSTSDLRQIYEEIGDYREAFADRFMSAGLDAIICPVQVCPAMRHAEPMELFSTVSYTGIFNLLDYAAGTVPVTEVCVADLQQMDDYPSTDPWYKKVHESVKGTVGLPVGVQVATPPFREEICLRILSEIETSKNDSKKSSFSIIEPQSI